MIKRVNDFSEKIIKRIVKWSCQQWRAKVKRRRKLRRKDEVLDDLKDLKI
jgi:hypothetical protein